MYLVNAAGYSGMFQIIPTSATSRPAFAGTSTWSVNVPSSAHANPRDGPTRMSTASSSSAGTWTGRSPEMVPPAMFVATRINGEENMIVLAEAHTPWFDLARPGNDGEARPLLIHSPKARAQLARFVRVAREWAGQGRVIDLYGRENLVLDRDRNVRYLDSFGVFFYADLQHAVAGIDDEYQERIDISLRRLDYLQSLLA